MRYFSMYVCIYFSMYFFICLCAPLSLGVCFVIYLVVDFGSYFCMYCVIHRLFSYVVMYACV